MKQELVIFLMIAVFGFLIWNRTVQEEYVDVSAEKPVEPAVIQSIVNSIQARMKDLYPVQTIYINPLEGTESGSTVYNARIMFLNTKGYNGVQYDVQADAQGRIIEMSAQVGPTASGPFVPYTEDKYTSFDDIQTALDQTFNSLKSN